MNPEVSIIIPTYNHLEDCLKPCIQSIMDHTDLIRIEVIVVANGCTDGTVEYINSLGMPFILIEHKEALGYPAATNLGILAAKGKYIVLFNNDNLLLHQQRHAWIDSLMAPFADDSVAIVGPSKLFCHSSKYHFIIFFCAMIKRATFDELGLLDESFTPGGCEDIEFAIRCQKNGYSIAKTDGDCEIWNYGTSFPIYHKAEQTVAGVPNWEDIFKRNNQTLQLRYRKKNKYAIVVDGTQTENLQPCIRSIYDSTDYSDCDITLLVKPDSPAARYADRIKPWGPYLVEETKDANVTIGHEVQRRYAGKYIDNKPVTADFVVVMDGRAILLGDKKWLSDLTKPFYQHSVDATSPILINGHAAQFLTAFRVKDMRQMDYLKMVASFRAVSVKNGAFPIYFPHVVT
jgi:GT2 family glycosyltransferase